MPATASEVLAVLAGGPGRQVLAQTGGTGEEAELPLDPVVIGAIISVGAVVAILVSMYALHSKAKRERDLPAVAAHLGLRFSDVDPFDSTRTPFPIFRAGDGRKVEHVMWNETTGARAFDYAYYVERRDENGRIQRTWTTFSCALAQHNGRWPEIRLLRERTFDRALKTIGLPDIELESEEFNRAYLVQCEDPKFAHDLLSPQMMELLLSRDGKPANVETKGRFVLVWGRRVPPTEFPGLLLLAERFCETVPNVVKDLYGEFPDHDVALDDGLGLEWTSREKWRDPAWDVAAGGLAGGGVGGLGGVGGIGAGADAAAGMRASIAANWEAERIEARRRSLAAMEGRDEEPAVEYDLDGNPLPAAREDPWAGRGRAGADDDPWGEAPAGPPPPGPLS